MATFSFDLPTQTKINSEIKAMEAVLGELGPTLRVLEKLIDEHAASLNTPNVDTFRDKLSRQLPEAIRLVETIAADSQQLATVSSQITKQLNAFDSQIKTAFAIKNSPVVTTDDIRTVTNTPGQKVEAQNFRA